MHVQPRMGKWRKGTPMLEPRGYGAAAALPGSVLFMGGGNGSTWMNSVLRYDLNTGTWSQVCTSSSYPQVIGVAPVTLQCL